MIPLECIDLKDLVCQRRSIKKHFHLICSFGLHNGVYVS